MTATKAKTSRCGTCLGTVAQHSPIEPDEGCWCPRCLTKEIPDRCRTFVAAKPDRPRPKVDRPVAPVGHAHPATATVAAAAARLRAGTRRKETYDAIHRAGARGMTDDELETLLGRSHQSVSATRNTLMADGLIADSGHRRRTKWGNQAIVWTVAGPE